MDKVARLAESARRELFAETAAAMNSTPAIAEKDFWVVWVLAKLFSHETLRRQLQFKGGTSLSKAFNLIGRFSEDVDLILDWRTVTAANPYEERSKNQQTRFNEATNEQAVVYIREQLLPEVSALLSPLCECVIDANNPFAILVSYPAAFSDQYLRAAILLEIGPLASWSPSEVFEIRPYAAEHFPAVFEQPACKVPTILAERTFWEKATILHQEAHRDVGKPMPLRYSRHYYDLALLARSAVKAQALADLRLLDDVVAFKQRFYPSAWAHYALAKPGSFRLLPLKERHAELERDYQAMQSMIFGEKLTFAEVLATLGKLEQEINALEARE